MSDLYVLLAGSYFDWGSLPLRAQDIAEDEVCPIMMLSTMSCCPSDVNILPIIPIIPSFRPISCCWFWSCSQNITVQTVQVPSLNQLRHVWSACPVFALCCHLLWLCLSLDGGQRMLPILSPNKLVRLVMEQWRQPTQPWVRMATLGEDMDWKDVFVAPSLHPHRSSPRHHICVAHFV